MARLELDVQLSLGPRTLRLVLATDADAVAVVGASGAGKSTLLRVVAGLERRARGTVAFEGETWQGEGRFVPAWERRVGWVPQDGVLFPHLTVRENLAYAARIPVAPLADALGIGALLDRPPRRLSGGERQRVALGRALAAAPRLLLLDEPFAALDRPLRAALGEVVAGWALAHGVPLLVVTHDPADIAALRAETWEIGGDTIARLAGEPG